MKRVGITRVDTVCSIVIVASLAALLMPVAGAAKMASKRSASLSRLRQLSAGLLLYQSNYEAAGYGSASKMGLPSADRLLETFGRCAPGVSHELWTSPCGYHPNGPSGFWSYSYHPSDDPGWAKFAEEHQGRSPLASDLPCSDVKGIEDSALITKSVPYVNLDGAASVKRGLGLPFDHEFFVQ